MHGLPNNQTGPAMPLGPSWTGMTDQSDRVFKTMVPTLVVPIHRIPILAVFKKKTNNSENFDQIYKFISTIQPIYE